MNEVVINEDELYAIHDMLYSYMNEIAAKHHWTMKQLHSMNDYEHSIDVVNRIADALKLDSSEHIEI